MPPNLAPLQLPASGRLFNLLRRRMIGLIGPLLQSRHRRQDSKLRIWRWRQLTIEIWPGVFPPGLTGSTAFNLEFLSDQDLAGKVVAEVGCGTGALSLQAARQGARVFATDINPQAVANCQANAARNDLSLSAELGNLVEPFKLIDPDIILVNPPYYPKDPQSISEAAWYCGKGHSYFHKLFAALAAPEFRNCRTWMNLSEDCDVPAILAVAKSNALVPKLVHARRRFGEWFYIVEFRHEEALF